MNSVESRNICKTYANGTVANKDINLTIGEGEIYVIAGPNGAGKTTFLRMVSTELKPTSGELVVMGYDVRREPDEIKNLIGVMPQEAMPYPDLTVWEQVYYLTILKRFPRKEAKEETERVLNLLGLFERKNSLLRDLSGGLLKRVVLAQALVGESPLLILDEPTSGLDPQARKITWDTIKSIRNRGSTIILSTHYLDETEHVATRVAVLNKGKVTEEGNVSSVVSKLGYEMMIEIRSPDPALIKIVEDYGFSHTIEDGLKLWIDRNSKKKALEFLNNIEDASGVTFHRPSLEEAYLSIVGEARE